MITHKEKTFNGLWPMTKQNTYYGYKVTENFYHWYKTKKTILKKLKGTNTTILRGTLIKDEMFINHQYLTLGKW